MRILAIETATEACSLALFEDGALLAHRHAVMGRGHAERLVPLIAELPDRGRADRILVSLGPGSFTGVRIGLAAARALGVAWRAEVAGYPTLALVAAGPAAPRGMPVRVAMAGGHGEWFVQDFGEEGVPATPLASLTPAAARVLPPATLAIGSRAEDLHDGTGRPAAFALPDARNALAIPGSLLSQTLTPLYGRAPDAALPTR